MFQKKSSGREKRRYKRVERRFVVTMQIGGDNSKFWDVVDLENISEGGMLFNHNENIKEKTLLHFKIKITNDREPILCAGRVVHARKLGELELHEYGISFTEMQSEDLALLKKSLE